MRLKLWVCLCPPECSEGTLRYKLKNVQIDLSYELNEQLTMDN